MPMRAAMAWVRTQRADCVILLRSSYLLHLEGRSAKTLPTANRFVMQKRFSACVSDTKCVRKTETFGNFIMQRNA